MRGSWTSGLLLVLVLASAAQAAPIIDLGPAPGPGIRTIDSVTADEVPPGTTIRLHAGHYRAAIVIPVSGTRAAPVLITGAADGPIELDGPIVAENAAWLVLQDLRIDQAADAAIILRHASHDIVVRRTHISGAHLGIWIGQAAGEANRIEDNVIQGSATHGIAVDGVNASPGRETLIMRNRIEDSGVHGVELSGNYYVLDGNIVSGSGRLSTGDSGIHVYAANARAGVGRHDVVRNNIVSGSHDATAQDGNGIQLDQWCSDDTVTGNIATGNDGAGISVFDAGQARIEHNTLFGNMRDPGGSHRYKAELVFATDDTHDVDGTRDAMANDNIVVATNPAAAALLVDIPTARHPPRFGHNLLSHPGGGPLVRWAGGTIPDIAAWNALVPHVEPDESGEPRFVDHAAATRAGFTLLSGQNPAWRGLGAVVP